MKKETRNKIVVIVVAILLLLSIRYPKCVEYYTDSELQLLKERAVKNDRSAINDLMGYYAFKGDDDNLFLVICTVYNNNIFELITPIFDNSELQLEKCPANPIQKIKEKNRIRDYYDHLYCLLFN